MARYTRQENDVRYRVIYPMVMLTPEFTEFRTPEEELSYEDNAVLEITQDDGNTRLIYNGPVRNGSYHALGDKVMVEECVPINRLWLKRVDGQGIAYKVPPNLPAVSGRYEFIVPDGADNIELFLDKYAARICTITRS